MDAKALLRNGQRGDYHVPNHAKRPLFLNLPLQVIGVVEKQNNGGSQARFGQGRFIIRRSCTYEHPPLAGELTPFKAERRPAEGGTVRPNQPPRGLRAKATGRAE